MFQQLKANTSAVPFTLGSGSNGYLGMLVSTAQYNTVAPSAPFVTPPMPGALVIDPEYTQYQIATAKTQYETSLREHQTYILMQRSLIPLVQQAVESNYTNAVRNRVTGKLPADIGPLKTHLLDTYGKINENELQTKYDETTKLAYNVSDPIDEIFNSVEDLCKILELANCPYSERQQVNIGYLIVSKQPIYK